MDNQKKLFLKRGIMKKFILKVSLALASLILTTPLQGAWNPAVNVSAVGDSGSIGGPDMDLNYLNNGVAIWTTPGIFNIVEAASYNFGMGWGPPVTVSDTSTNPFGKPVFGGQGDPSIAINNSNYVVAAWEGFEFIESVMNSIDGIFAVTRSPSGVWSSVQRISALDLVDDDFDPENPCVDVSDSGFAIAVWNEIRNSQLFVMSNSLPFGGSWGVPVQLAQVFNFFTLEDTPMVRINSSNNAAAVWKSGTSTGAAQIGAATFNAGTNLWTSVVLDTADVVTFLPRVGIDENGNAVAVWTRTNGTTNQVVSSTFNFATGTWGPILVIASVDTSLGSIGVPYVVVDRAGNATAVWEETLNGITQVYGSTLTAGTAVWTFPVVISTIGINNDFWEDLAQNPIGVDPNGNVIVVYRDADNALFSVAYFIGFGWQTPELIDPGANDIWNSIRFGTCGFALALWNENTNTARAADNFGLLPPPTGFNVTSCCEKFATQRRCVNTLTWDSNSCAVFFQILRNGVVIATLPAGTTSFVDPVCRKNESVTYSIIAINILGGSSLPAVITTP